MVRNRVGDDFLHVAIDDHSRVAAPADDNRRVLAVLTYLER